MEQSISSLRRGLTEAVTLRDIRAGAVCHWENHCWQKAPRLAGELTPWAHRCSAAGDNCEECFASGRSGEERTGTHRDSHPLSLPLPCGEEEVANLGLRKKARVEDIFKFIKY